MRANCCCRGRCNAAPLGAAECVSSRAEVLQHVAVVTLEFADAGEAPPAVALWIRRIPQLARRAHAHRQLCDVCACDSTLTRLTTIRDAIAHQASSKPQRGPADCCISSLGAVRPQVGE